MANNSRNASPRIGRLDTLAQIRREMTRVYRAARRHDLDLQELRTFIYALQSIAGVLKDGELQVRLDAIEGAVNELAVQNAHVHSRTAPEWVGTTSSVQMPVQN